MRRPRWFFLAAGVAALALIAAACGGGEEPAIEGEVSGAVQVEIGDFFVNPSTEDAAAGSVTFEVENTGTQPHEFVVIQTDLAEGDLPLEGGTVAEAGAGLTIIDEIEPFSPGSTESLTVDLEAGAYVLICNVAGHYQSGMHTSFNVT
jgi:uncharacterized cupredoxin-like copper-binding protein